jgi:hypothetical protein
MFERSFNWIAERAIFSSLAAWALAITNEQSFRLPRNTPVATNGFERKENVSTV